MLSLCKVCAKRGKTTNPRCRATLLGALRSRDHFEGHGARRIPQGTKTHAPRYNAETQVKRQAERGGSGNSKTVNRPCRNVLSRVTVGVDAVSQSHISRWEGQRCQLSAAEALAEARGKDVGGEWHGGTGGGARGRWWWRAGGRRWVLRLGRRWLGVPTRRLRSQIAVSRGTYQGTNHDGTQTYVQYSTVRYFCVRDR